MQGPETPVTPGQGRLAHAPADHPPVSKPRIGVLLANLGTPDAYDYWSMRRYLNEFLSDKRVIDYPSWKWQPLLQLIILTKRPFTSGANYKLIWNEERNESPLMTITKEQTAAIARAMPRSRRGDQVMVDFCMRYGNPSTEEKVQPRWSRRAARRSLFFPLYPQYAGRDLGHRERPVLPRADAGKAQPAARTVPEYFDRPDYIDALARSVETPMRA
jgi:ferrochelatase